MGIARAAEELSDLELCLYDTQKATIGGAKEEFIFSARLDNLVSSFCGVTALIEVLASMTLDRSSVVCVFLAGNRRASAVG
jgi:aspartyl aminopeptidase